MDLKISFVGGGKMAEAIVSGIVQSKLVSPSQILVSEPVEARRLELRSNYSIEVTDNNLEVSKQQGLLFLAVKPQNLKEVCDEINGNIHTETSIISIVAGANLDSIKAYTNHSNIVRVMPNTPAQISEGMAVWTAFPEVSSSTLSVIEEILDTLGKQFFVKEEKYLDMSTALSASGPAYVFMFIESLIDAGVYLGMPREMARKLTLQTLLGSTKFVENTGKHPAELKDMVTSPAGTTIEAILSLENDNFRASVINGVVAAYERSLELG